MLKYVCRTSTLQKNFSTQLIFKTKNCTTKVSRFMVVMCFLVTSVSPGIGLKHALVSMLL